MNDSKIWFELTEWMLMHWASDCDREQHPLYRIHACMIAFRLKMRMQRYNQPLRSACNTIRIPGGGVKYRMCVLNPWKNGTKRKSSQPNAYNMRSHLSCACHHPNTMRVLYTDTHTYVNVVICMWPVVFVCVCVWACARDPISPLGSHTRAHPSHAFISINKPLTHHIAYTMHWFSAHARAARIRAGVKCLWCERARARLAQDASESACARARASVYCALARTRAFASITSRSCLEICARRRYRRCQGRRMAVAATVVYMHTHARQHTRLAWASQPCAHKGERPGIYI